MEFTAPKWAGLLAHQLGITREDVLDCIKWDFIEDGEAVPSFADLKAHIEYQQTLQQLVTASGGDEHVFADLWCQAF